MRVELWRCSVKEAKSSGETTCALASAAILEKSRNKDSLMAEGDTERRSTDFKGKWGRIGMAGAWPGDPAIIQTVCCYVDLQAASAADTRVLRKKVMYFVEADCSGTSLIDLVTITIPGEYQEWFKKVSVWSGRHARDKSVHPRRGYRQAGRKNANHLNHYALHHCLPSTSLCTASIVCEAALHCTLHRSFRPITCPHGHACSASKRGLPHHDNTTKPRLCPQASAVRTR